MKLWTIFLSPEVLSFRCEACDETVRLIGEPYRAAILVPPRLPDQRLPVVRQR